MSWNTGKQSKKTRVREPEADEMSVDDEENAVEPASDRDIVHESRQDSKKSRSRTAKQKFVPSEESSALRDQRTVFIGNLPLAVAQRRPLQKQLQKHLLALVPTAKIESMRFRSVPFKNPTSKLPTSDDDEGQGQKKPSVRFSNKITDKPRHGSDRANSWRTRVDERDEQVVKQDEKKYLTPGQKKKIAFIHHEFHTTADSINAYVVFAHAAPSDDRPANLPPLVPTLDPYEAAKRAVEGCNNTLFMDRVIRVDWVGKVVGRGRVLAEGDGGEDVGGLLDAETKFTIFVGNLDFASKQEDLRVFFENLLIAEKGAPPENEDGEEEAEGVKKSQSRVIRVRIVRDKETQLGKGFAYIQFADKECVDEILALEDRKLKFAKRKLRVQRCKTLPGSSIKVKTTTPDGAKSKTGRSPRGPPVVIPKGDPTLGERLAHLPKIVRKAAKAADGDRIARRLAKKKARMAMGPPGDKSKGKDTRDRSRKLGLKEMSR